MPRTPIPAAGGALPGAPHVRLSRGEICQISRYETRSLSSLIRDPFVRRAFERAEREDGTTCAMVAHVPRKPLQGGAEAQQCKGGNFPPLECRGAATVVRELDDA